MSDLSCRQDDQRRRDVRPTKLFGLDFVELADDTQRLLDIFFLGAAPEPIEIGNVRIRGGETSRTITVSDVMLRHREAPLDDFLEITLENYGDFSTYTLDLVKMDEKGRPTDEPMDGFDPLYRSVDFRFKASCPSDLDCKPEPVCPKEVLPAPEINYLAKDYASFRQLLLDRLALTMPDWTETHIPDIGITLVELLAYVGDYLSYYQDAVATEAYLGTARQRISVRRHARLVDYAMHEGCNARTWMTVAADQDGALDPLETWFCTGFPGAPTNPMLQPDDVAKAPLGSTIAFAPLVADPSKPIPIWRAHNEIAFYSWGNTSCCLAKGATGVTLADGWDTPSDPAGPAAQGTDTPVPVPVKANDTAPARKLKLTAGDILIFEEVLGPHTGNPVDADPKHRQAVRLTKVTPGIDPLYDQPVVEIEWCGEDALAFPLCLSSRMPAPDCSPLANVSVARGNVILVDNASPMQEDVGTVLSRTSAENCPTDCEPRQVVVTPERFRTRLAHQPLTFSQPLPACGCAARALGQDPRQALPRIALTGTNGANVTHWTARADLLESGPADNHFVVEMDDSGTAHLRFGNGSQGRMPEAGTGFTASYTLGNGPSGNVGAEAISFIVFREITKGIGKLVPRNPFAAMGATSSEPVSDVKLYAPHAFKDVLERCITAADYGTMAGDNARRLSERPLLVSAALATVDPNVIPTAPGDDPRADDEEEEGEDTPALPRDLCLIPFEPLQKAKGALRWTGSWYEAQVAVDPLGREGADGGLLAEIDHYLEPYRRIGHDLSVKPARYAPLDIALSVCVAPNILRGHVERALLDAFSDRVLPGGKRGFFHVDNLTFGSAIYASRIVAAAQGLPGVTEVRLLRLERYVPGTPPAKQRRHGQDDVPAGGVLALAPFEIPSLDNDPPSPGKGRLTLYLRGGR
ncbi:MAG TPA: hypothetical protein VGF56_04375 [Rhizomicrobium sp.]